MAASADQNIPVVVNMAATAINDSRVADLDSVLTSAAEYLGTAGYRVSKAPYPQTGAASTGFDQLLDLAFSAKFAFLGKAIVWITTHIRQNIGTARRRALEVHFPLITFIVEIPPEYGLYDAPSYNAFGGLVALLPDLQEHLLEHHPNRRYSFEIIAPVSFSKRRQNAFLRGCDLEISKLLKLIKVSSKEKAKDGTAYRFGAYFPYMLEIYPPADEPTKRTSL